MNLINKKSDFISSVGGAFTAIETGAKDVMEFIPLETSETLINSFIALIAGLLTTFLKDKLFKWFRLDKSKKAEKSEESKKYKKD